MFRASRVRDVDSASAVVVVSSALDHWFHWFPTV